jgi:hypothetical protein
MSDHDPCEGSTFCIATDDTPDLSSVAEQLEALGDVLYVLSGVLFVGKITQQNTCPLYALGDTLRISASRLKHLADVLRKTGERPGNVRQSLSRYPDTFAESRD